MKTVLFFVFSLVVFTGSSQTIERLYDYRWKPTTNLNKARFYSVTERKDSLWVRNDYYIFEKAPHMRGTYKDSAEKIKHGDFTWYHANGYLKSKGSYINNKAVGTWVSYHENGSMKDSSNYVFGNQRGISLNWHYNGYLADSTVTNTDGSGVSVQWFDDGNPSVAGKRTAGGKMHGKWQFFHKNGNLSSLETYDNGQLLNREYFDEKGAKESDTTNKDRDVDFPGGMAAWQKYLEKHLYWPPDTRFTSDNEAVVLISWTIDEEGRVIDAFVSLPFHPEFDKIALRVIKQSPKWKPAISHNRKVKAYRSQPVTFAQVSD